jgi:microcystin-dependent protein
MPVYDWSQTANTNASADPTINYEIGMAPSAVGSSGRAVMAAIAQYRDDIAGAIVTSGTSTAYTLSSYSDYTSFTLLAGQMIAFTPHVTNGATVMLNVDSLGPKPLRSSPGVELQAATIIQGTPYVATYNNTDGAFYLHGFFGNPYNIPLGAGIDFWGATAPNSSFAFPAGQAISRTTYATLFALIGTGYGAGDGSTTFNIPDLRGRLPAVADNMGGTAAGRIPGFGEGSAAGASTVTLSQANLPAVGISIGGSTSGYSPTIGGTAPAWGNAAGGSFAQVNGTGGGPLFPEAIGFQAITGFSSLSVSGSTAALGSNASFSNLPPILGCNYIIRII